MDDYDEQGPSKDAEFRNQPWVLGVVFGGLLLFSVAFFVVLVVPKTHIVMEATCSPLADPKLEQHKKDGTTPDTAVMFKEIDEGRLRRNRHIRFAERVDAVCICIFWFHSSPNTI
jgi:hypothetical protein